MTQDKWSALNEPQREAVLQTEGPVLVLAGAGSGKTRVLTYRVAYLIEEKHVDPYRILAITFTNKAAREMKERISKLATNGESVFVSTFHAMCVRMLRRDADKVGYARDFTIYDAHDQLRLIERCLKEHAISENLLAPRAVLAAISDAKNAMVSARAFAQTAADFRQNKIAEMYAAYEHHLQENQAMDFDDLLVKTVSLFAQHEEVLHHYATRFQYIHVDEYQDTNAVQYALVRQLSGIHGNLCVVGDDDQSIYGWRGADIRNILDFEKDYPAARVIRLEQNYRSTGHILEAANVVIRHNQGRKSKKLWTDLGEGEKVMCMALQTEQEEADFICETIEDIARDNAMRYDDIAVLYRANAQSRVLEGALMRYGIPYRVYGGLKFYDRKEIKDIVAYLRLTLNPADEVSLLRVINTPKRGLGEAAVQELRALAKQEGDTMMGVLLESELQDKLSGRIRNRIARFAEVMKKLVIMREIMPLREYVELVLTETGYVQQYVDEDTPEARNRVENIREFVHAVEEYTDSDEEASLPEFLDHVSLVSDIDGMTDTQRAVTLMTLHSAKGLEFPVVFMAGMEEGVFPHARSMNSQDELEEERRLCYVGITRAKQRLFLTCARQRALFGERQYNLPSRFLKELPAKCCVYEEGEREESYASPPRRWGGVAAQGESKSSGAQSARTPSFASAQSSNRRAKPAVDIERVQAGVKVHHDVFGDGTVVSVKGEGLHAIASIAFDGRGIKQLALSMAPITIVEDA